MKNGLTQRDREVSFCSYSDTLRKRETDEKNFSSGKCRDEGSGGLFLLQVFLRNGREDRSFRVERTKTHTHKNETKERGGHRRQARKACVAERGKTKNQREKRTTVVTSVDQAVHNKLCYDRRRKLSSEFVPFSRHGGGKRMRQRARARERRTQLVAVETIVQMTFLDHVGRHFAHAIDGQPDVPRDRHDVDAFVLRVAQLELALDKVPDLTLPLRQVLDRVVRRRTSLGRVRVPARSVVRSISHHCRVASAARLEKRSAQREREKQRIDEELARNKSQRPAQNTHGTVEDAFVDVGTLDQVEIDLVHVGDRSHALSSDVTLVGKRLDRTEDSNVTVDTGRSEREREKGLESGQT